MSKSYKNKIRKNAKKRRKTKAAIHKGAQNTKFRVASPNNAPAGIPALLSKSVQKIRVHMHARKNVPPLPNSERVFADIIRHMQKKHREILTEEAENLSFEQTG